MANAKLHIICGNCGCNDMFTYKIVKDGHDISGLETKFKDAVFLSCGNCATLHDLENNAEDKTDD